MDAGDAIEAIEGMTEEGEDEHAGHGHGLEDPHFWFDPPRVKIAVDGNCSPTFGARPGPHRCVRN